MKNGFQVSRNFEFKREREREELSLIKKQLKIFSVFLYCRTRREIGLPLACLLWMERKQDFVTFVWTLEVTHTQTQGSVKLHPLFTFNHSNEIGHPMLLGGGDQSTGIII